ncbi:unnamed protein product [Fusarium graminearum]|nr:unnamed protein product [Fusarium graminearum]
MPTVPSRGGSVMAMQKRGIGRPAGHQSTGGKTILGGKRHRKILRDNIHGITKTVTVQDVIHSLSRMGRPLWGFDLETYNPNK